MTYTYEPSYKGELTPDKVGVRFAIRVRPLNGAPSSLIVKTFLLNKVITTKNIN